MKLIEKVNAEVEIQHPELDITTVDLAELYCSTDTPEMCIRDRETYEKYEEYAKTISKETMEKLEKVNVPLLEELKEKLLETGKGIEQESFLIEE